MDWDEQNKRALEILKDPGAEEQQWLDACNQIVPKENFASLQPSILEWPVTLALSFCSGFASIVGGFVLGGTIVTCIWILSGVAAAGTAQALPALIFIAGMSTMLGFILGLCRRTPAEHAGLRSGLIIPIFSATVIGNIFCSNATTNIFGSANVLVPLLSLFLALEAYRFGSKTLNRLLVEQRRGERKDNAQPLLVHTEPNAISLARSVTESKKETSAQTSEQVRIDPEKLHLGVEILQIEREKMKIEREKLELEREKLQIEVERMRRNTKRRRPDSN